MSKAILVFAGGAIGAILILIAASLFGYGARLVLDLICTKFTAIIMLFIIMIMGGLWNLSDKGYL